MAIQYSLASRTSQMSQLNTTIGINAVIKIFSGAPPANCGTTDSGTLLVTFAGNASQFGVAASQVLTASEVASAVAGNSGTAGYFRIYPAAASATNAIVQGTVAASAADMIVTNVSIASGQTCNFSSLTITEFGA